MVGRTLAVNADRLAFNCFLFEPERKCCKVNHLVIRWQKLPAFIVNRQCQTHGSHCPWIGMCEDFQQFVYITSTHSCLLSNIVKRLIITSIIEQGCVQQWVRTIGGTHVLRTGTWTSGEPNTCWISMFWVRLDKVYRRTGFEGICKCDRKGNN